MRSNLGANMNQEEWEPKRGERVIGAPTISTLAWRGRKGTFHYRSWARWGYVTWDGNIRISSVLIDQLLPELQHREW